MRFQEQAAGCAILPGEQAVRDATAVLGAHQWLVLLGRDGVPIGVLARDELCAHSPGERLESILAAHERPPVIVMNADTGLDDPALPVVIGSLQGELPRLVLLGEDETVTGVLGRVELAAAFGVAPDSLEGFTRGFYGLGPPDETQLPGPTRIRAIVRLCHFLQHRTVCGVTRRFARKPRAMPPCANPRGLVPHDFGW